MFEYAKMFGNIGTLVNVLYILDLYCFNLTFYFFSYRYWNMGLHKQYLKVGQNARDQIFGLSRGGRTSSPLSMLISKGAKLNNSKS